MFSKNNSHIKLCLSCFWSRKMTFYDMCSVTSAVLSVGLRHWRAFRVMVPEFFISPPPTVQKGMLSFHSLVTLARKVCSTNLPSFHLNLQAPLTSFPFCLLCSGSLWIISFESPYTHLQGFDHFLSIYISLPSTLMKGGICFLAWMELFIHLYFTEFLKEGQGNRASPFALGAIVSSLVFTLALPA